MEIKLTVTEQEANLILQSLSKQPFEVVSTLIFKIQAQGVQQINEAEAAKADQAPEVEDVNKE